jgi:hypothetical protein
MIRAGNRGWGWRNTGGIMMKYRHLRAVAGLFVLAVGLGCDSGSAGPRGSDEAPAATPAAVVTIDGGMLAPGQEWERCHLLKLDLAAPLHIERIVARASGMHHLVVQTIGVAFEDAVEPCFSAPERLMDTGEAPRVLFSMATGATESELAFPDGYGFRVEPRQQLMIDFHALNFRIEDRPATVTIELYGSAEPPAAGEIGYAILNNTDVDLPPGVPGEVVMHCTAPFDVELVSLTTHMHMLGRSSQVKFVGGARDGELIHTSGDWNDGGMTVFDPPLRIAAGDTIEVRCDYRAHEGDASVGFGPSASDEMCQIEGYVVGKDTILGGTVPALGIEQCLIIRLDETNQALYRSIVEVFSPKSDE